MFFYVSLSALALSGSLLYLYMRKYPSFPAPLGSYSNIGVCTYRFPGAASQIFYPCSEQKDASRHSYLRPGAVKGLANWLKLRPALLFNLALSTHPCSYQAPPHILSGSQKYPVIVFSHGLGGTYEVYTQLSRDLASYGFIVIVLEHEDQSGSYAVSEDGKELLFERYQGQYERKSVVEFRKRFLTHRVNDIKQVLTVLTKKTRRKTRRKS